MDQPLSNNESQVGASMLVGGLQNTEHIRWRLLFDVMPYAEMGTTSRLGKGAEIMSKTMLVRKCKRCNKTIYRIEKEKNPSDLYKGSCIALHMITCDRERYDAIINEHFIGWKD